MYFQLAFALDRVQGARAAASRMEAEAAVQGRPRGRHEGDGRERREGPARGHRGHARRHDHRRVREDRDGLAWPPRAIRRFEAAVHRAGLPADARAARLPARQRLQDVHRLRRRRRVHAALDASRSTASRPSRSSAAAASEVRAARTASRCCCGLPTIDFIDDKAGQAGRHPADASAAGPILAFGNSDGDFEMLEWTTSAPGPRFGLIVHHTDAEREWAYDRDSHIGQLARGARRSPEARLDRRRHEEGLESDLPVREIVPAIFSCTKVQ